MQENATIVRSDLASASDRALFLYPAKNLREYLDKGSLVATRGQRIIVFEEMGKKTIECRPGHSTP